MAVELNDTTANKFSETDASNTAPAPDGAPAGTVPSQAEPIWRGLMATVKRFYDRINGTVTTTGASGTYTYTPVNATYPTSYVTGETFSFKADKDSAGSDVMNINALGNKNLKKFTSSGKAAIAAGDIKSGMFAVVQYDGTDLVLQNPIVSAGTNVSSIADATNGGLSFSASTGAVTAKIAPGDLTAKASPASSDLVVIGDAAASNQAKTSTAQQLTQNALTAFDATHQGVVPLSGGGTANFLRADATWAPPGNEVVLITTATASSATTTISGLSLAAYSKLIIEIPSITFSGSGAGSITLNNDTGANYYWDLHSVAGGTGLDSGTNGDTKIQITGNSFSGSVNDSAKITIEIGDPGNGSAARKKNVQFRSSYSSGGITGHNEVTGSGSWNNTAAITRIDFTFPANPQNDKIYVYGVKNT